MALTIQPGQKTLAQLRQQARSRADQLVKGAPAVAYPDPYADSFITSAELDSWINDANNELFGLLVTTYGNYYQLTRTNFQTDGAIELYPLPQDMLKLQGVDWVQSPGSSLNNITLRNFMMGERNAYSAPYFTGGSAYPGAVEYQLSDNQLWFKPLPSGGSIYQVLYVPLPLLLADTGLITMNAVTVGAFITINESTFTAIAFGGSPTAAQFVVGGTSGTNLGDTGTAQSLADQINASVLGGRAGDFQATATTDDNGDPAVAVVLVKPSVVTWAVSSDQLVLTPNQTSGPGPGFLLASSSTTSEPVPIRWTNVMSGFSGWWEYLALSAAIEMVMKEESDASALGTKFEILKRRIKAECDNRDQGSSARVTDIYAGSSRNRFPGGGFGGGGWGDQ